MKKLFQKRFFTFCHQILLILTLGANISSRPRTILPLPYGFFHFAPLSRWLIALKSPQYFNNSSQNVTLEHTIEKHDVFFARNFYLKYEMPLPVKCVFCYQVPKHITLNDVIMVTGIIEIQTIGINGIRDILAKNFNGMQDTQIPLMEPY